MASQNSPTSPSEETPYWTCRSLQAYTSSRAFDENSEAVKDSDDHDVSLSLWRPLQRASTSTPATLTRLFAVQAPTSPPSSRLPSFNQGPASWTADSVARSADQQHAEATTDSSGNQFVFSTQMATTLFQTGFVRGLYADVAINAFETRYDLHRIVLQASPFFASAFSGPWTESSSKEMVLFPEEIDPYITKDAFEIALERLYGRQNRLVMGRIAQSLLATGSWLEMQELVEDSVACILKNLKLSHLGDILTQLTANYYGEAAAKVMGTCHAMLNHHGATMSLQHWSTIPAETVCEIVGGDAFFIRDEWERWRLAAAILNQRLKIIALESGLIQDIRDAGFRVRAPPALQSQAFRQDTNPQNFVQTAPENLSPDWLLWIKLYTHPDIQTLHSLLDTGIHFAYLEFEQLQHLRTERDVFEVPSLLEKTLSEALWMEMALRHKVVKAAEGETTLQLNKISNESPRLAVTDNHGFEEGSSNIPDSADSFETSTNSGAQQGIHSLNRLGKTVEQKFLIPDGDRYIIQGDPSSYYPGIPKTLHSSAAVELPTRSQSQGHSYSEFPPFRFTGHFPNPRFLRIGQRYYSRPFIYGGSYWDLYVCRMGRPGRGMHIGIYLHRSPKFNKEMVYRSTGTMHRTSVDERIGALERSLLSLRNDHGPSDGQSEGEILAIYAVNDKHDATDLYLHLEQGDGLTLLDRIARGGDERGFFGDDPDTIRFHGHDYESGKATIVLILKNTITVAQFLTSASGQDEPWARVVPHYNEPRPVVQAYFKVYYHSRDGKSTIVMESGPEKFRQNKSWGWKSTLVVRDWNSDADSQQDLDRPLDSDDDDSEIEDAVGGAGAARPKYEGSHRMKFTVAFGLV